MEPTSVRDKDIADAMNIGLAELWRCRVEDVEARIHGENADIQLSAKLAMTVAATMERILGRRIFVPNDFATDATRIPAGESQVSPNGCMDPAEDVSLGRIREIARQKTGMAA